MRNHLHRYDSKGMCETFRCDGQWVEDDQIERDVTFFCLKEGIKWSYIQRAYIASPVYRASMVKAA